MSESVAKKKPNVFKRIGGFFKELKSEIKKIVWPTRKQVANNTLIVIVAIVIIGIFIWAIDSLLSLGIVTFFTR